MLCKSCGFEGKVFSVRLSYEFYGALDVFGYVVVEGQADQSSITVHCPECGVTVPSLTGEFDDDKIW